MGQQLCNSRVREKGGENIREILQGYSNRTGTSTHCGRPLLGTAGDPASQTHKQNQKSSGPYAFTNRWAQHCSKNDGNGDSSCIGLFLPAQKFGRPLLNQVYSITQRHQMAGEQKFFF